MYKPSYCKAIKIINRTAIQIQNDYIYNNYGTDYFILHDKLNYNINKYNIN